MKNEKILAAIARQQSAGAKKTVDKTSINKVLTFYIGEQVYGIEIPNVIEIIGISPITKVPDIPDYIKGIINVRSKVVPVINIRNRFGKPEIPFDDRTCIIIVTLDGMTVGLIVDKVADVLDVTIDALSATPDHGSVNSAKFIQYIIRTDNDVKLVLDIGKLLGEDDA